MRNSITGRATHWPALGVGLFGLGVGLAWAARPSIWYDEAATLSAIRRPPDELLRLVSHVDAVHAAYYFTAWVWSLAFGDGIVALRAWSAVGLGVTAALVLLLVDRLISRSAAIWAGTAAALLPGLSWSGLEGRSYAWSAALAVLSTNVLVAARERGGTARWAAYALVATLMTWWSFFAGLMLLVHGVALLVTERRPRRGWILAGAAASVACLPLVVLVHAQSRQLNWIDQTPMKVLQNVGVRQVLVGQRHNAPGLALYEMAAVGLGVLILTLVLLWLRSDESGADPLAVPLVLTWAILPTLILAGANVLGVQVYQSRYLIFSTPAVAIAAGAGLAALPPRGRLFLGVLGCALVLPIRSRQTSDTS